MKYEKLSDDELESMLDGRLRQFEAEHFGHSVNLKLLEATGATDSETKRAIAESKKAMETLDAAHAEAKKELGVIQTRKAAAEAKKPPTT